MKKKTNNNSHLYLYGIPSIEPISGVVEVGAAIQIAKNENAVVAFIVTIIIIFSLISTTTTPHGCC